jgi:hypothetical protein
VEFEVIGRIHDIEPIAVGSSIRVLPSLRKRYGAGRWRKLKGRAKIQWEDGTIATAELHWYEAHGIGRRELKVTRWWY